MSQESISPLALIAVFAGVIEASALASLPFLSESSQTIYTWFLVGFPFFLTVLFFLTLNFNSNTLFAPDKHDAPAPCPTPDKASPSQTSSTPPESLAPKTIAKKPPETGEEPMVIAISGPDSRKLIENQVLRLINRPVRATRRWTLYNLDTRTCIQFKVSPMQGNVETPPNNHQPP
ncbi:hypothetical protein [Pseudomonas entomophila]|uniref:hypothetical protein n=1 Tax=Pseudomonas entomophila TaxID=312306 RepID=UPI001F0145A9|nr:hypothetical protein [Pseudomonas entomophila]MCG8293492.1 hypothetical protein [Pseudomonas entomophila]